MRRYRPAFAGSTASDTEPFGGMNITPLIDVMLVLLVMFILTIPAMTHEVPIELPSPSKVPAAERVTHRLVLGRDGGATLDGMAISDHSLAMRLGGLAKDPAAAIVMRTDPEARYERFDQVLAVVKGAGITRLGFEGNSPLG